MAGSPAVPEEFVASAIVWLGTRSGGGGEVRKRTAPRRHVTPTRARPDSRGTVISLPFLRVGPGHSETAMNYEGVSPGGRSPGQSEPSGSDVAQPTRS